MKLGWSVGALLVAAGGVGVGLCACVGDTATSPVDAGSDVNTNDASDGGNNPDSGGDAGPKCVYVDGGPPGTIDQSFSNASHAEAVGATDGDVDSNGNIYVLALTQNCVSGNSDYDFAIFKYLPSGAADNGFGVAGRACVGVPVTGTVGSERPLALRLDPQGNIVVAGTTGNGGFNPTQIVVARLKPTGQLDATFGTGGIYSVPVGALTYPVAYAIGFDTSVNPPKVLVAGADGDQFKPNTAGFALRLTSTGQADNGFNGGTPLVDANATGYYGITADSGGNVYATGSAKPTRDLIVSKWTTGGTPATFGTNGKVTLGSVSTGNTPFSEGRSVVVLSNGKIVIGGIREAEDGPVFVAQLTSAGALDTAFAAASPLKGVLPTPMKSNSDYAFGLLHTRCDGRYLAAGYVGAGFASVAKVSTDGVLEPFGSGDAGVATTAVSTLQVAAVEDPSSGRVVLMGRNGAGQLVLERYQP